MSRYLAPAALVLLVQAEAHAAVVRHLLAAVDQHVDVVRVVQRLALAPDHREGRRHVGGAAGVGELHLVAVDRVREQLSVDARHPTLDVELADEPGHVTRVVECRCWQSSHTRLFCHFAVKWQPIARR